MIGLYLALIDNEADKRNFEKFYMSCRKTLFIISFRILNDYHLAEDAVSETFFYIARNFSRLHKLSSEQLELYCLIAVKNRSKNIVKSNSQNIVSDNIDFNEEKFTSDNEMEHLNRLFLEERINRLAYNDKEVLTLYYYYGLNLREISKIKRISHDAAKKRLQSARNHLKIMLEESEYEEK